MVDVTLLHSVTLDPHIIIENYIKLETVMESKQNVNHLNLLKQSATKKQNSSLNLISD